jgi:hypothetical protein
MLTEQSDSRIRSLTGASNPLAGDLLAGEFGHALLKRRAGRQIPYGSGSEQTRAPADRVADPDEER